MFINVQKNSAAKIAAIAACGETSKRALATAAPSQVWALWTQCWRQLRTAFADHYRPERHYMRGPGPKWRATHRATALTR